MRTTHIAIAAALLLGTAPLASAQPAARASEAQTTRDAKAQTVVPPSPGRVERFLDMMERRGLLANLVAPRDGVGVRVGGIDEGGGLALGPSWQYSSLASGHVQVHASAAMSIRNDREVEFGVRLPHLAGDRVQARVTATATELAQEHFYGLGAQSLLADRTAYAMGRRSVNAAVVYAPARALALEAGTGLLRTQLHTLDGRDVVGQHDDYLHSRVAATFDTRDQRGNPRSGGRYHVALNRFDGGADDYASFNRLDAEVEQHVSAWKKQRMITLRAVASFTDADAGHDVPFYMQRTLGGSRLLRGFVHDRFRDRNLVVLQGEYGWDVSPFLNAVVFYETGMVAAEARDLALARMRRDYGFGMRFGSARTVALRTDVAFGSGEGTRFIMRFNHAF